MKNYWLLLVLLLAICPGCVTQYRVTLANGSYYTTYGKPHFDKAKNRYVFKDASSGTEQEIPPLAISEIAPVSMHEKPKTEFLPSTSK